MSAMAKLSSKRPNSVVTYYSALDLFMALRDVAENHEMNMIVGIASHGETYIGVSVELEGRPVYRVTVTESGKETRTINGAYVEAFDRFSQEGKMADQYILANGPLLVKYAELDRLVRNAAKQIVE